MDFRNGFVRLCYNSNMVSIIEALLNRDVIGKVMFRKLVEEMVN